MAYFETGRARNPPDGRAEEGSEACEGKARGRRRIPFGRYKRFSDALLDETDMSGQSIGERSNNAGDFSFFDLAFSLRDEKMKGRGSLQNILSVAGAVTC